jgi:hypothetical protein
MKNTTSWTTDEKHPMIDIIAKKQMKSDITVIQKDML